MTDHCFSCYLLRGITSLLEKKNVILCCLTTTLAISIWISQIRNGQWQSFLQFQILKIDLNWRNYDKLLLWSKRVHICQKFQSLISQLSQNRKKILLLPLIIVMVIAPYERIFGLTHSHQLFKAGVKKRKKGKKDKRHRNIWTKASIPTNPPPGNTCNYWMCRKANQTDERYNWQHTN